MADDWDSFSTPIGAGKPQDEWDSFSTPLGGRRQPAAALTSAPRAEEPLGPFGAGVKGMGADLRTAGAAVGTLAPETYKSITGATPEESLDAATKIREEVARRYHPKVPSYQDIAGPGDLLQYLYERGAESLPQMGATLGAGAAAVVAAPAAVPAAVAGVAGGTAAALPFFLGQNIEEQLKDRTLSEASLTAALPAAAAQGALDTVIGKIFPGVGKAAAGWILLRAAKKGAEGAVIEGSTEALQEAIQIAQAKGPAGVFDLSPEVQSRLAEAAVAGGLLGGAIGAGVGSAHKRKAPEAEVKTEDAVPPESPYQPMATGLPGEPLGAPGLESGTGLPEVQFTKSEGPISGWYADKTGLPMEFTPAPGAGLVAEPTSSPDPDFEPMGTGLPMPRLSRPLEAPGIPSGTGLPEPGRMRIQQTGQQVYRDVQQKLLAAGVPPMQANANAFMWRKRYETLGSQLGVDAFSAYKASNVEIQGKALEATSDPAETLNQDPIESYRAKHYSVLKSQLFQYKPTAEMTGQQWLNRLKKAGVKDEELVWTGVMDGLDKFKNDKLTGEIVQHWFKSAQPAIYKGKPGPMDKAYQEWTLGEYGKDPKSNYTEVVLALENMPKDTYKSSHFNVPNAVGHYRTTDRTTADGKKVLLAEEFQSDWHQDGRKRGYRGGEEDLLRSKEAADAARARVDRLMERAQRTQTPWDLDAELDAATQEYAIALDEFYRQQKGVPDAPFKDSWPNLLFRHALFDAINNGQNYIAWPTGDQQAERYWSNASPEKRKGMQAFYDKRIVDYANKLGKPYGAKVETLEIPGPVGPEINWKETGSVVQVGDLVFDPNSTPQLNRMAEIYGHDFVTHYLGSDQSSGLYQRRTPSYRVHALPITPQMRELLTMGGHPLFQRKQGTPQGNITVLPDRAIIRLFKSRNESTFMHESAHLWLEEMRRYAKNNKEIAQDLKTTLDWFGVQDPSQIRREHHEQFARGFEQYLRTGRAPSASLVDIFKQFADWLRKIYQQAADLKVKLTPEIEGVYKRILTQDERFNRDQQMERSTPLEVEPTPEATFTQGSAATFEQTPAQNPDSNYNVFQRAARATKAFFDPFSEVPQEATYRDIRNLMTGGVWQAEQSAYKAKKLFDKLSLAQKDTVNTYFETQGASPMMLPPEVRAEAQQLKAFINGPLRQSLVDNNLLPQSALSTNDDSYLPRLYLKHLLSESNRVSNAARLNKDYAKKKKDKTPEELIAMGEVKDPGTRAFYALFRTQRDLAVLDFLNQVAANGDWALKESLVPWNGKKVTPYWLKQEADSIMETRIHGEPNPDRKALMKIEAEKMRQAATDGIRALDQIDYDASEYRKLPDTADFGPLRGMIVRKQIAADIIGTNNFVDPENTIDKWFGDRNSVLTRAVSHWKALKVPMNLPSQMRNIASNLVLLNLSGVPIHMVGPRMYQAAKEMLNNGPHYQIAKKYGVGKGTFSEQELFAINDELKRLDLKELSGFMGWRKIARALLNIEKKATDIHGKMEEWGKVAKIIDAMKRGMPENEAVREANKWLFDYSEAVPSIKRIRQMPLGMPFVTFQYKMIPLMYEIIKNHKTRLLPYIALAYTIPAVVAAGNGIDEDDAERLRKALSTNLRRKQSMYLLPFKDDAGRWQFVDIGYFMPWQMPFDFARYSAEAVGNAVTGRGREATKDAAEAFRATSLLSNPVLNIAAALTTGIDPFTDRPIADKRDPMQKQVGDIAAYAWSLSMPSLLASYGALGQLIGREQGAGVNRFGEPPATYGQIAARALGVNTYPVMPEQQRARNIQYMQREIQDVKARMSASLKDQSLTMEQRRRIAERFKEEIQDRNKELVKYVRESALSPALKAASARP